MTVLNPSPPVGPSDAIPYAPGSIALGIHALSTLPAGQQLEQAVLQAKMAESAGFDGVTLSEHHAGIDGYLPQPLQVCGYLLEETRRVWSGPTPTLLTMRNPHLLAEEIAWAAARYPGRFAAGFAAGYTPSDFEAVGLDNEGLATRFAENLSLLLAALGGEGLLGQDAAIAAFDPARTPLAAAVHSMSAARQVAGLGLGALLIGSGDLTGRVAKVLRAYEEAGGTGPRVWIRRVFVGELPQAAVEELDRAYGTWDKSSGGSLNEFVHGSAEEVAARLLEELKAIGPTSSLNLRVHLPGMSPTSLLEQIDVLGSDVLPLVRAELGR
jgi:alkanesulfonate monooxygenase SsuD/methylene tetrahydromethanopterin reductase-like flavin-dependent oxidoreductase (luciferase family)